MKKFCEKLSKKLLVCFMLVVLLFPSINVSKAEEGISLQEGEFIASFARQYIETYGSQTMYTQTGARNSIYFGTTAVVDGVEYYRASDCASWCAFVYNKTMGIDCLMPGGTNAYTVSSGFLQVGRLTRGDFYLVGNYAGASVSQAQPGDLLISSEPSENVNDGKGGSHIVVYIGDGLVAESPTYGKPLQIREAGNSFDTILRLKAGKGAPNVAGINSEFNFQGMTVGTYKGRARFGDWLFNLFTEFMDYLAGLLFLGIKIQLVGWTNQIEKWATEVIQFMYTIPEPEESNVEGSAAEEMQSAYAQDNPNFKPTAAESSISQKDSTGAFKERLTVEDIVYNRIPIFDANFFSEKASGVELSTQTSNGDEQVSPLYLIRQVAASWYVAFRRVVMVAMLIILIYVGIRMLISTAAGKRVVYRKMLTSWAVAFVMLFVIHYFMVAIVQLNAALVEIIENAGMNIFGNEVSMYDTIRTRAYDFKLSVSLPAVIIYIFLAYLFIRYAWVYIKRTFTIMILIIMAPFIAGKYALDKIKGKGGSTALTTWMSDFAMTVFVQTIHALLYTIFIQSVIELSADSFFGFILSLIYLNFMLKVEPLFRKMLKFGKSEVADEVNQPFNKSEIADAYVAYGTAKAVVKGFYGIPYRLHQGSKKYEERQIEKGNQSYIEARNRNLARKEERENRFLDFFGNDPNLTEIIKNKQLARHTETETGRQMKLLLDEQKKLGRAQMKQALNIGINTITGFARIMGGIPMIITSPGKGIPALLAANRLLRKIKKPDDYGHAGGRLPRRFVRKTLYGAGDMWLLGIPSDVRQVGRENKKAKEKIKKKIPGQMRLYAQGEELERNLKKQYRDLEAQNKMKFNLDADKQAEDIMELSSEVDDTRARITKSSIDDVITAYMFEAKIDSFSDKDIDEITSRLEKKFDVKIRKSDAKIAETLRGDVAKRYKTKVKEAKDKFEADKQATEEKVKIFKRKKKEDKETSKKQEEVKEIEQAVKKKEDKRDKKQTMSADEEFALNREVMIESYQEILNTEGGTVRNVRDNHKDIIRTVEKIRALNDVAKEKYHKEFFSIDKIMDDLIMDE